MDVAWLRGGPAAARSKEENTDRDANAADNGSDRNRVLLLFVNFERAEFSNIFLSGVVGVTAVGQHHHADNDKNDSENTDRFHLIKTSDPRAVAARQSIAESERLAQ